MRANNRALLAEGGYTTIDNTGKHVDVTDLADGSSMVGGGYELTVQSQSNVAEDYVIQVICQTITGTVTYAKQTTMVAPGATGNLTTFCSTGNATGTISNIGQHTLFNMGDAPIWPGPSYLGNLTATAMPLPSGWEVTAINRDTVMRALSQLVICQVLPVTGGQTFIYYQAASLMPYYMKLSVPDGKYALGLGFDGFPYNYPYNRYLTWHADWGVPFEDFGSGGLPPNNQPRTVTSEVRSFSVFAGDTRYFPPPPPPPPPPAIAKAGNTIVAAVLTLPQVAPPPAATIATIVEFYNQALDHYFITAAAGEISDLDNGVHKGWARTGQSFHAYAAGSTGHTGRQPVCRAYGNPAVGLDSHFYSAAMNECFDTLIKFGDAWLLEASEVFEMELPDANTGACPAGDIPVYRLFNNRADANHRYTTSIAIRDQMAARGYIAEGYGPNNVTLCALP